MDQPDFIIHSDGASRKDKRGGWGVTILCTATGERTNLCGGAYDTTNNRMELQGAIEGLLRIPVGSYVELISDSEYVVKDMPEKLGTWRRRGWRTGGNKPTPNLDLWKELIAAAEGIDVTWLWVRGHTGNEGNEMADRLAAQGVPDKDNDEPVDLGSVPARLADARARGIKTLLLYEDDE